MGKSLPTPPRLQQLARVITSNNRPRRQSQLRPVFKTRPITSPERTGLRPDSPEQLRLNKKNLKMEAENSEQRRLPLSEVVADCVKRWFQDTLKEAKAGETAMQVLVGQMYCSGYGLPKDAQKVYLIYYPNSSPYWPKFPPFICMFNGCLKISCGVCEYK